ncbi:MAG: hypothetical protein QMD43_08135 [Thermodesulfovibrio sp.]|uniref:hypothetical protein n=1 Tax=unclassified Thermodesulfovibrio TaxID=2645936 RepID=UPI0020B11C7D|nr:MULTISPECIES: hypothetical protein [unclassified Thermodesulfovibrio]MDI1471946.1 hypothetical protein [Thermodesulfovibrio sp. 1176]MDI6714971.1 hypothetical protein [Thermodesulfovibrio sp.]
MARIPNPSGITKKAGPGKTNIAIPINSNVKPIIAIINLFTCFISLLIKNTINKKSH